MKVAVGLRRVAAGKRTSGRRAAQIALVLTLLKEYALKSFFLHRFLLTTHTYQQEYEGKYH